MNTETTVAAESVTQTQDARFHALGVRIWNVTVPRGVELLEECIKTCSGRPKSVFFVNAHTLNLACADPTYRDALNSADFVFGDGTGVRWAARLRGVRMAANLVGTDFTPSLFQVTADRGYSYFMLGGDEATVAEAAVYARSNFPGWNLCGIHHGFLKDAKVLAQAIEAINAAKPDVLLVGMGNPLQERWILENMPRLQTKLCLGIGGLFDYWAGNVSRAPAWIRRAGHEWLWRLFQQPKDKAKRYLIGNPLYMLRMFMHKKRDAALAKKTQV